MYLTMALRFENFLGLTLAYVVIFRSFFETRNPMWGIGPDDFGASIERKYKTFSIKRPSKVHYPHGGTSVNYNRGMQERLALLTTHRISCADLNIR